MFGKELPLTPKSSDGILKVLAIGRLSKPKATDEQTTETINRHWKPSKPT